LISSKVQGTIAYAGSATMALEETSFYFFWQIGRNFLWWFNRQFETRV